MDPGAAAAQEGSSRRVYRLMYSIAAVAAAAAWWKFGWRGALGLAVGAAISVWNYGRLEMIADAITRQLVPAGGEAARPRRAWRTIIVTGLRYALILGALYVIVKYLGVNLVAALAGLFVCVVAVFINALLEWSES